MYMKQTAERAAGVAVLPQFELNKNKLLNASKWFGGFLLLVAGAIVGFNVWQHASSHESTDDAYVTGHVTLVSPRVEGVVKQVLVDDNEYVKAGQPLLVLDSADFKVALENADASLIKAQRSASAAGANIDYSSTKASAMKNDAQGAISSAESSIARAKAALENARAGVPIAQSALKQKEADLHLANLNYERMKKLNEQGAISQQDFDTAARDRDVAKAAINSATESVTQAQAQVNVAEQNVADAEAQAVRSRAALEEAQAQNVQSVVDKHQFDVSKAAIAEAQAKVDNAKLQLSYTVIVAPVSGRIGKKSVEPGQHVNVAQPLMAVVPEQFWVVANFKETQLANMKAGQPVDVKIDALAGKKIKGFVDSFSPGSGSQFALLPPDNATGNFTKIVQRVPVKIVFDQKDLAQNLLQKIVPGMSAEVEVDLSTNDSSNRASAYASRKVSAAGNV